MLGAAALACGCALRGQIDILESRLRQQEDSIAQLQGQLSTSQSQLQAARRETEDLNTQLTAGTRTARVEQLSALGQVEAIELNKFLTGGLDRDGIPGDELFSAVIVPTDSQGNLVKVPGSVSLTLFDLSQPEAQQRIGRWEFHAQTERIAVAQRVSGERLYRRASRGKQQPHSANLLVHARLKTIDGRQFDTSQSIRIVPPAGGTTRPTNVAAAAKDVRKTRPADAPPAKTGQPNAETGPAADTAWWDERASDDDRRSSTTQRTVSTKPE